MSLDHLSDIEEDELDLAPTGPLNDDDIAWATERAMSSVADRSTEKRVLAAPSDADARDVLVESCRWWGGCAGAYDNTPAYLYSGQARGLRVRRSTREGLVTWDEMIQRVRHPETVARPQLALF